MGQERGRLDWVEAGRGVAACLVMVSHAYVVRPVPLPPALVNGLGTVGVGFFFVLSGFIMVHVHGGDIGRPATVARFAWRRIVRIWPTYWVVLAIAIAVNRLQRPEMHAAIGPAWLWHQLSIWPGYAPFVGPAWTLRHELLFYALFATLLIDRRIGSVILAGWTVLLATELARHGLPSGQYVSWGTLLLHPINLYFPCGMALGWAVRAGRVMLFATGAAGLGAIAFSSGDPRAAVIGAGLLYAGLLGLLVRLSVAGRGPGKALVWLGAVSYAVYLLHLSIFTLLRGAIGHSALSDPVWPLRVAGQVAAALAAAGLLHAVFERPVLRRLGARRTVLGFAVGRPEPSEVAARA